MKKQEFFLCLLFLILLMLNSATMAQNSWRIFTNEDGTNLALEQNSYSQIFEDSKGNIWFLIPTEGVMKYDGTNWTNYSKSNGLRSDDITTIYEDSKGTIWLGSKKGLMRYNGNSFEVISSKSILVQRDSPKPIKIIEDSSGNIWFGSATISSFDGENVYEHNNNKKQLPSGLINLFYYDEVKNIMWIGGLVLGPNSGMSSFDGKKWQIHKKEPGAPTGKINCIITDDNGILFAGTNKGVYCYDGASWTSYSEEHGLVPDNVILLHKDSNNKIWAITGKPPKTPSLLSVAGSVLSKSGLSLFYDGEWHTFADEPNIPDSRVINVFETSKGELWFDTFESGIYRYDGSSWYEFKSKNGFRANHFLSIYEDSKGNVWFGLGAFGQRGIGKFDGTEWTFLDKGKKLPYSGIGSILEDSKGNMWFGTDIGILRYSQ